MEMIRLFLETGWVAKSVFGILTILSLASWVVIFAKAKELAAARRESLNFAKAFRSAQRLNEVAEIASQFEASPLVPMFQSGYAEIEAQVRAKRRDDNNQALTVRSVEGVDRALSRAVGAELERLGARLPFLATTASAAPFIGLFGTVWGIMGTFQAIGAAHSTSIGTVAPGIAEALINTAAGLAAAIPAVVAYNHLIAKVRELRRRMEDFRLELLNLVDRNFT